MAVVSTSSGPWRTLAVLASCLLGGVVGALLHGALYEKHGWFSGFGFAFGAVVLGLIASVVVDFGLPLVSIVWTPSSGSGTYPPPAVAAQQPGAAPGEPVPLPPQYPATVFSIQLLVAFLSSVAAGALLWVILKLVGLLVIVPGGLGLVLGILAVAVGAGIGWRLGYALARVLDLTVE